MRLLESRLRAVVLATMLLLAVSSLANVPKASSQKYGGKMDIGWGGEPKVTHVNYQMDAHAAHIQWNIFDKLLGYDVANGELIPGLAERWEISPDGKIFTFYLARNVKFHDGKPLTSADVKWTIESAIKEKGVKFKELSIISGIETPDEYTVKIFTTEPTSRLLPTLSSYYGPIILPKHLWEGTDVRNNKQNWAPIGSGPFKFAEWVQGQYIRLIANDNYFRGRPYLDELVYKVNLAVPVLVAAAEAGDLQLTLLGPSFTEIPRLQKSPTVSVALFNMWVRHWVAFNMRRKPLDNPMVRKAIVLAVNRSEISEKLYMRVAPANLGPHLVGPDAVINPFQKWVNPNAKYSDYNPEEANKLLDQAGLPRAPSTGIRFSLKFIAFSFATVFGGPEMAELIREQLKKVGIEIRIENQMAAVMYDIFQKGDYDMHNRSGVWGPDPDEWGPTYTSKGTTNSMGYNNSRMDELFLMGGREIDVEKRKKIYSEVQEILVRDLPMFCVVEYPMVWLVNKKYQGFFWQEGIHDKTGQSQFRLVWWEGATGPPKTTTATTTRITTTPAAAVPTGNVGLIAGVVVLVMAFAVILFVRRKKSAQK